MINLDIEFISAGIFESDEPWIHPKRIIDSFEIIIMYNKTAYICEDEINYTIEKNNVFFLEPSKQHYGTEISEKGISFAWLHFKTNEERYKSIKKLINVLDLSRLKILFSQLLHISNTPIYEKTCCDLYTSLILEEIITASLENDVDNDFLAPKIKEYARININENITVKKIAEHYSYHQNHISRVFKNYYKVGLKEYIDSEKIKNIQNLLCTTIYTISQIADLTGFDDDNHLIKFFKYHCKMTPTKYRNTFFNTHINKE